MPQIFLSYNREDQAKARLFADAFAREGLEVWWDATLRSGEAYDEVTENALRTAKAVVVLWSKKSVASRWVRAEATLAERSKTFLPVTIEHCERPIMFELTQTSDLSAWNGDSSDPAWRAFVSDVQRYVGRTEGSTAIPASASHAPSATRRSATPRTKLALIAVPALIALGVGTWLLLRDPAPTADAKATTAATPAPAARSAASVAVVPFTNLTGEADKEYFSDGMAEELVNALAKVPGLKVASRTSSFAYKGKSTDIRQIARELGVSTVIEGSVRSAGDRVRVSAQLTSADSGYQVWSESYDRRFDDLFKLQDDLAREIVAAFRKTMGTGVAEFESSGPPTNDLEAYQLYLKGAAAVQRASDASMNEGIKFFEQAVARDPRFARAYSAMASARMLITNSSLDDAERDARRALELDPSRSEATLLGVVYARRLKFVEAEEQFRTLATSIEYADHANHALGTLWPTGKLRDATRELLEGQRLAPADASAPNVVARAYSTMGNDVLANRYVQESIVLGVDAGGRRTVQTQSEIAARAGRYVEAGELFNRIIPDRLRPLGFEKVVTLVYAALEERGKGVEAVKALQAFLPRLQPDEWVMKVFAMQAFSQLGALDAAYEAGRQLQQQFEKVAPFNPWAWLWVPELRAFRKDARFQPFVTRLNMIPYWEKYGPPDDCTLTGGVLTCR